jgi:flagellar hook-length control protein FliK
VTTVDVTGLPVTTQPAPRAGHGAVPVDLEQIPSGAPVVPVLPASVIPRTRHSAATNRYAEASAPATAQAANGRVGRIVSEAFDLESEATPEAGVELDALDTSDEPNVPRARSDSAPPRPAMRAVVDSVRSDDRPVDTARPLGVTTLGAVSPSATGLSAAAPLAATPGLTSAVTTPLDHTFPPHLVRSARFLVRQGGGEARIRLQPAHLGEVVMTVKVDQGTVTAVLQVDSEAARSWIRTHQDVLRASLGEQGLGLERFTVTERDRRDARDGRDRRDEPTPRRRSTSSGPTATRFEIHV